MLPLALATRNVYFFEARGGLLGVSSRIVGQPCPKLKPKPKGTLPTHGDVDEGGGSKGKVWGTQALLLDDGGGMVVIVASSSFKSFVSKLL